MVAFARAKAKFIFSKIWATHLTPETQTQNISKSKTDKPIQHKVNSSQSFLKAIKSGGIWLS